jgi:hypothetical protein
VLQLDDYMDTQLPSLNYVSGQHARHARARHRQRRVGAGPGFALYGAGAFNGVLLTNSRAPFQDQGLSVRLREGSRNLFDG